MNRFEKFVAGLFLEDPLRYFTSRRVLPGEVVIEELKWDKDARTISVHVIENGIRKTFVVEAVIDMILNNAPNLEKLRGGFLFDRNLHGTPYMMCSDNDPAYDEAVKEIDELKLDNHRPQIPEASLYIYLRGGNFELLPGVE